MPQNSWTALKKRAIFATDEQTGAIAPVLPLVLPMLRVPIPATRATDGGSGGLSDRQVFQPP
ncbi:MAG TPA: hypothetical protein IGS37_00965 [Synechococcales cyanobacterium M55_K2018_004]|nr:hypothetical protein [Synechococcales cyanobacterium M55_K2018_004]